MKAQKTGMHKMVPVDHLTVEERTVLRMLMGRAEKGHRSSHQVSLYHGPEK